MNVAAPAHTRGATRPRIPLIGILIIAHDNFGEGLVRAVTHVLGGRPPQFEVLSVAATDDPTDLLPAARELASRLDDGDGLVVFSDIYGATPCNLATKLAKPGRVAVVAGVNLPMLVRACTYRNRDLDTTVTKAISGARDGVLRIGIDTANAAPRG
jgi:PTS system mannose-specific IIA component